MGDIILNSQEVENKIGTSSDGSEVSSLFGKVAANEAAIAALKTIVGTSDDGGGSHASGSMFARLNAIITAIAS